MHSTAVPASAKPPRDRPPRPQVRLLDLHPREADLRAEVLAGLAAEPPSLPCKLFYDETGSQLFDQITRLPEYYPTRTELALLYDHAPDLAACLGHGITLLEYGSGSSTKTRLLLDALDVRAYVPVDISRWYLTTAAERLGRLYPRLPILPVVADYTGPIRLPAPLAASRLVGFFPGSTIGNFAPAEAVAFLRRVAATLGQRGRLIIGVDLKKDPALLHAAYNDSAGITAAFNLNILARLNRELGAGFDLSAWRHYAPYNPTAGRVEMHLVSLRPQRVSVAGRSFDFPEGRSIHTENSYKYTLADFAALAQEAGFEVQRAWTDARRLFSVQLLSVRRRPAGDGRVGVCIPKRPRRG